MLNQDRRAAIFEKYKTGVDRLHKQYLLDISERQQLGLGFLDLAESFNTACKLAVERVELEFVTLRESEPKQLYERICDVPEGMTIMCPWLVQAISYKYPRVRTFEFELNYGAFPQYWPGWKDFPDWSYAWTIKKPQDFDRHFRVL